MKPAVVTPLYEGTFSVGIDKQFNKIGKDDPPHKGALKLSINPFLIRDNEFTILFDAGIGDLLSEESDINVILDNLSQHGLSELDVTHIFISHLHYDHFAGLANRKNGYWDLTFPDAKVYVSDGGWAKLNKYLHKQPEEIQDFVHFLESHAELVFLPVEESNPIPPIRVKKIGGHTEYHQVLFYENDDSRYLMAGDVIGRRIAINKNFAAKFDFEPKKSMEIRNELKKIACKEKYTLMAYHETDHPLFNLIGPTGNNGYIIENV